jgi:acylphosphatase
MSDERNPLVTRRYEVYGRVQGVGFRAFVIRNARSLGVGGWVRNRSDGSVEALVSGRVESHEMLCELLQEGPRWSRVTRVEWNEVEGTPVLPVEFSIHL